MQPGSDTRAAVNAALDRIQQEYLELLNAPSSLSLLSLFHSEEFQFDDYCKDFSPHRHIRELKHSTIEFGQRYGILLPNAEHYVTCAMFLFPAAPMEKILLLSKNYAVDFYLNDTMGREAQPTNEEKKLLYEIRDRLAALGDDLHSNGDASLAEKANLEVLSAIQQQSPENWFKKYLRDYLNHINVAHKSYDATSLGYIQKIEDYIQMRCFISGMPHTVSLIEYGNNVYLDWPSLEQANVAPALERLNWTVSLIGALSNDLFSFEKEVIDHRSDSNLIPIMVLNNFRMKLKEAILVASSIIRNLLSDYVAGLAIVKNQLAESRSLTHSEKKEVERYLEGLKAVLQACWMWQIHTKRYKRETSIWQETGMSKTAVS